MTSARSLASFHRSGSDIFKKNVWTPNQCANYHLKLYNSVLFINSFCNINSHAVERCTEFDKRNALCAGMLLNGLGCFLLNFWFLMPCQFSLFELPVIRVKETIWSWTMALQGKHPQHARNTFLRISAWTQAQDLSAGRDESGQVELFEKFQIFDTGIIAMSGI